MKYEVKDPSVIERESLERQAKYGIWPKGRYDFEILSASETVSRNSGKEMIVLDVRVFNADGHNKDLKDYIVETQPDKMYSLCKAIGQERLYLSGAVTPHDLLGATGKCTVGIETGQYNGDRTQKNKIAFYLPRGTAVVVQPQPAHAPHAGGMSPSRSVGHEQDFDLEDSIPF